MSTEPHNRSAFELRFAIVNHLMCLEKKDRDNLANDLTEIEDITKFLDNVISGKSNDSVGPSLSKFKTFVSQQKIQHPQHGTIKPEWRDWYGSEFTRLSSAALTGSFAKVEQVYFPRQCGLSTFICLYAAFMAQHDINVAVMPDANDTRRMRELTASFCGSHKVMVNDDPAMYRATTIGQVIMDNSPMKLVSNYQMTSALATLRPCMVSSPNPMGAIFQYWTIE